MREFVIQADDANQRVDKFIQKTMKTMPKSLMYKYIRNKKIKVNRKRCEISQRLIEGDTMQCYIAEEFFEQSSTLDFLKVPAHLDILYEDEHFLIMNKEKGLRVHRDTAEMQDNLLDRMLHYLYDTHVYDPNTVQSFTPALCHRLDRNTQGMVIGAKSAQGLREMNEKIANREIKKQYLCIVEGHMAQQTGMIRCYHHKKEDNTAIISDCEKEGYVLIETGYRVLDTCSGYSLIEVDLHTGKSHQIRAVMAYLKHPLYGDVKYGAQKNMQLDYQALCAYRLAFTFPKDSDCMVGLAGRNFVLENNTVLDVWGRLSRKRFTVK